MRNRGERSPPGSAVLAERIWSFARGVPDPAAEAPAPSSGRRAAEGRALRCAPPGPRRPDGGRRHVPTPPHRPAPRAPRPPALSAAAAARPLPQDGGPRPRRHSPPRGPARPPRAFLFSSTPATFSEPAAGTAHASLLRQRPGAPRLRWGQGGAGRRQGGRGRGGSGRPKRGSRAGPRERRLRCSSCGGVRFAPLC